MHVSLVVTAKDTREQEFVDTGNVIIYLVEVLGIDTHVQQTLVGE